MARRTQDPTRIKDLHAELLDALVHAQSERDQRQEWTASGELGWVVHERATMVDATTALLIRHHLPVDLDAVHAAVRKAERQASGHFDYSSKWAVGCAEYIAARAHEKASQLAS